MEAAKSTLQHLIKRVYAGHLVTEQAAAPAHQLQHDQRAVPSSCGPDQGAHTGWRCLPAGSQSALSAAYPGRPFRDLQARTMSPLTASSLNCMHACNMPCVSYLLAIKRVHTPATGKLPCTPMLCPVPCPARPCPALPCPALLQISHLERWKDGV